LPKIAISPFVVSRQKTSRDECIEEVASRATVDLNAAGEIPRIERAGCELRKNSEFDRAQ
jgi:hypothetical protein